MTATATSTDLVTVSNRRGGKDKIHRADCRHVLAVVDSFYVRPLRNRAPSHRIYVTCETCLKGYSTMRLPAAKTVAQLEWDRMTPEAREIAAANVVARKDGAR